MKIIGEDKKKLQGRLLELLIFFKTYCEENKLQFFLAFGTCLGAVREKGFIKWDDDVDIIMPVNDYVKLRKLWPSGKSIKHYTLCDASDSYYDGHLELTIRDDNTTYISKADLNLDTNHGIMIEISPLSYSPKSKLKCIYQSIHACIYAIFKTQRVSNTGTRIQKCIIKLILLIVRSSKTKYKLWKYAEKYIVNPQEKDKTYMRVFGQFHTLKKYYPSKLFEKEIWLPFESTEMPVPVGYDEYLTILYGDYMTPPPIEDRIPEHNVEFIDCDNSYLSYRGIKYLIK